MHTWIARLETHTYPVPVWSPCPSWESENWRLAPVLRQSSLLCLIFVVIVKLQVDRNHNQLPELGDDIWLLQISLISPLLWRRASLWPSSSSVSLREKKHNLWLSLVSRLRTVCAPCLGTRGLKHRLRTDFRRREHQGSAPLGDLFGSCFQVSWRPCTTSPSLGPSLCLLLPVTTLTC